MADPVLTVTDKARKHILELRSSEPDGDQLALWLEVAGERGGEFVYDMYFEVLDAAAAEDHAQHHDDLPIVIPHDSIDRIAGSTLDMNRDLLNPGMVLKNPNRPPSPTPDIPTLDPSELSGTPEEKVRLVLERQINPSIAAHGGRAELVAVEGSTAYLRLGGGCVGCGMASVTLGQGIEVAIKQSIPEITEVVDVTDHASGTNPYYEAAKK
jgi:Fe/S biogenesis protein NfuA